MKTKSDTKSTEENPQKNGGNSRSLPEPCKHQNCMLFSYCPHSQSEETFLQKNTIIFYHYRKGQQIIVEDNPVMGIFFIQSGKVKVYRTYTKGHDLVLRFAKDGEVVGHRGFGSEMIYPISAAALVDSTLCFVPKDDFYHLLHHYPKLTFNILLFYADELKRIESRFMNMSKMTVKEKTADALLELKKVFGMGQKSPLLLNAELFRKDIADFAGISPEQLIGQLKSFKSENLIRAEGRKIWLKDLKGLEEMVERF